jgi:hypothetical protein
MFFQNYKVVEELPQNPDPNTFYFIKTLSPPYIYNSLASVWLQIKDLSTKVAESTEQISALRNGISVDEPSIVTNAEYGVIRESTSLTDYLCNDLSGLNISTNVLSVNNGIVTGINPTAISGGVDIEPTEDWSCIKVDENHNIDVSPVKNILNNDLNQITTNKENITEISNKINNNTNQITTINGYLNNGSKTESNGSYLVNSINKGIVTSYSTYNKPDINFTFESNWHNTDISSSYSLSVWKSFNRVMFIGFKTGLTTDNRLKISVKPGINENETIHRVPLNSYPCYMLKAPKDSTITLSMIKSDSDDISKVNGKYSSRICYIAYFCVN